MSRRERKLLRRQGKKYEPDRTITETTQTQAYTPKKTKDNWIAIFYEKYDKKALWVMVALIVLSLVIIGVHTAITGEFIPRGVSLKGGVTITVPHTDYVDVAQLQSDLEAELPQASLTVREMTSAGKEIGFIIDASDVDADTLLATVKTKVAGVTEFSVETMGSSLGESFFKQVMMAMGVAFILMSIVVFISFRTLVPSGAVILCAFADMTMTIAIIDIFGIKVETAGIAALLMLIGYSVDTDVLLTTRVLKREEGTVMDRIVGAFKTGMTMTLTAIAAVVVAYIFTESETLKQIMLILFIGLVFDILNTWITNVGILQIYVQRKAKKHATETLADYKKDEEFEEVVDLEDEAEEEAVKKAQVVHHKPVAQEHHEIHHPTEHHTEAHAHEHVHEEKKQQ